MSHSIKADLQHFPDHVVTQDARSLAGVWKQTIVPTLPRFHFAAVCDLPAAFTCRACLHSTAFTPELDYTPTASIAGGWIIHRKSNVTTRYSVHRFLCGLYKTAPLIHASPSLFSNLGDEPLKRAGRQLFLTVQCDREICSLVESAEGGTPLLKGHVCIRDPWVLDLD